MAKVGERSNSSENVANQVRPDLSALNPMAEPWIPENETGPIEERTIFITFSRGHALSELEITWFFVSLYGDCLEEVFIARRDIMKPPLFGKVVFKMRSIVEIILGDQGHAIYQIGTKTLGCKRFKAPRTTVGETQM